MVVIQRVRMRWSAGSRGSQHANLRSGLPDSFTVPDFEAHDVVVHDVLLDEAIAHQPTVTIAYGLRSARTAGTWLEVHDGNAVADQLPGWQAFPMQRRTQRLFTFHKGQTGRYRANFRSTGRACAPQWYYEQWTTHITNDDHPDSNVFVHGQRHYDVDHRVHLYGGHHRPSRKGADPGKRAL